ncbi:MAG: hypothetical protein EPO27_10435 [Betaproteobacteria bacterium]|nr:MAG: hypothetical protein EPO27_10435 [Betaproteobacteria bacterium]
MATIDKIIAAINTHGAMTSAQLVEKLPAVDHLHTYLSQYTRRGRLAKKGYGKTAVYSVGTGKPAGSAPPQRRKTKKKAERAKSTAVPAKKARVNGSEQFVAAITHDRRLLIVDDGRPGVFTAEQTNAIADVILTNFEVE